MKDMPADKAAVVVDVFIGAPVVSQRPKGLRVHLRDFNPEYHPGVHPCRYCTDPRQHRHSVSADYGAVVPVPKGMTR